MPRFQNGLRPTFSENTTLRTTFHPSASHIQKVGSETRRPASSRSSSQLAYTTGPACVAFSFRFARDTAAAFPGPCAAGTNGPRAAGMAARRAASPPARVAPRPSQARRSRLTRAGRVPVALPLFPPGVFYQRQPARNRVTNHRRDGHARRVRFLFECRSLGQFHHHAQLSPVPRFTPIASF